MCRPQLAAAAHSASGSGSGFVPQTASGSTSGPDPTHTDGSASRSRLLDANLPTQTHVSEKGAKASQIAHDSVPGEFRLNFLIST